MEKSFPDMPESHPSLADIQLSPPSCENAPTEEVQMVMRALHSEILKAATGKPTDTVRLRQAKVATEWILRSGDIDEWVAEGAPIIGMDAIWVDIKQEAPLRSSVPGRGSLKSKEFEVWLSHEHIYDHFFARVIGNQIVSTPHPRESNLPSKLRESGMQLIHDFLYSRSPTSVVCRNSTRKVNFWDVNHLLEIVVKAEHGRDKRAHELPSFSTTSLEVSSNMPHRERFFIRATADSDGREYIGFTNSDSHSEQCDTAKLTSRRKCNKEVGDFTITSSRLHIIRTYGQNILAQLNQLPSV